MLCSAALASAGFMRQWPETTVPKFGEWDGSEDLSYSIVFDKVRADKERFMPTLKNDSKDLSLNQQRHKTPGLIPGKEAPTIVRRTMEPGSRGSEQSTSKLSSRHNYRSANDQKTYHVVQGDQSDTSDRGSVYSSSMASSCQQPIVATKDLTAREMIALANGSNFHVSHDGLHGKVQRVPGPTRQKHQEYLMAPKMARSQGCSETSSIADLPEKVNLPKFGDWDVSDAKAGEGFTVIFDRARDEKKSKVPHKTPTRLISPMRPSEDLYRGSQVRKKKRGWLNALCCVDTSE
ncbi:hypothetical protein GOP47_0021635 [Adiantum capillus-veneris]|uniref:RIN4 pathogenic type III effector avirulence factor Avr cleavage site domain-containing protein n=1 Tax=Adiantum capillus-veneris TaxID=13818 RepID=A0A9D4U7V7_ADICA|nr:hypothetical protein GOP47_0021635 [Adiantum capillus-veneris]